MKKNSLNYITFLQFVGPIFVIIGHSMNNLNAPPVLALLKQWIYVFHMPLFFFISGYLFTAVSKCTKYTDFALSKFKRLIIPYIFWNTLFVAPKIALSAFINDSVSLDSDYITYMLLYPRGMILGSSWFLFALFLVFLVAPLFRYMLRNKVSTIILSVVLIILYLLQNKLIFNTMLFSINDLCNCTWMFGLGMILGKINHEEIKRFVSKKNVMYIYLIVMIMTVIWFFAKNIEAVRLLLCLGVIAALFVTPIYFKINSNYIEELSSFSFGIYILHWPAMVVCSISMKQIFDLPDLLVIIACMFAGYLIPAIFLSFLKKIKFLQNYKFLSYILGV